MEYKLTVDDDLKAVVVATSGPPDITTFKEYCDGIAALLTKTNYLNILGDHQKVEPFFSYLDSGAIREYAEYIKRYKDIFSKARIATVVDKEVDFGIVRTWDTIVDALGMPLDHKVFKDMDEARRWLKKKDYTA